MAQDDCAQADPIARVDAREQALDSSLNVEGRPVGSEVVTGDRVARVPVRWPNSRGASAIGPHPLLESARPMSCGAVFEVLPEPEHDQRLGLGRVPDDVAPEHHVADDPRLRRLRNRGTEVWELPEPLDS